MSIPKLQDLLDIFYNFIYYYNILLQLNLVANHYNISKVLLDLVDGFFADVAILVKIAKGISKMDSQILLDLTNSQKWPALIVN